MLPSSRTRVFQYLPHLQKKGIESKVIIHEPTLSLGNRCVFPFNAVFRAINGLLKAFARELGVFRFVSLAGRYDVLFMQKVLLDHDTVKKLKKTGKKIVFDFDDAIFRIHETDSGLKEKEEEIKKRFDNIVGNSDLIVLENDHNAEHVGKSNVLKITGPIDTERYAPRKNTVKEKVVIGWIGSRTTTIYLKEITELLRRVTRKYGKAEVLLIGADPEMADLAGFEIAEWKLDTEVGNLARFDIGVMPLKDDEWTRGKGGYKLLQYMAMGIPSVASPVGINRQLIRDGHNGYLAGNAGEWLEKIEYLINNPGERARMGANARKDAEQVYSFHKATEKLVHAINEIL